MLFVNPLTPRVKPWVIESFPTFDSMDRTPKCEHLLERCWAVLYCGAVCFSILPGFVILKNLSILDLALSRVKELSRWTHTLRHADMSLAVIIADVSDTMLFVATKSHAESDSCCQWRWSWTTRGYLHVTNLQRLHGFIELNWVNCYKKLLTRFERCLSVDSYITY